MTRRNLGLGVLSALLFLNPLAVSAGDLLVEYNVDDKALKAAVSGTMLTFELYSDSLCNDLVYTQPIAIDDVTVSRLKLFTPVNGTKPPKTDTIRTGMFSPNSSGTYLKVTGTGITPVGGDCQLQAGGTSGKVVSISTLNGDATNIPGNSGALIFVGPTTLVQATDAQIITASASLAMSISAGSQTMVLGVCHQPLAGGALTNFASSNYMTVEVGTGPRIPYSAVGAAAPGAGTWKVGMCVQTIFPVTIDDVDYVNGWVMVAQ